MLKRKICAIFALFVGFALGAAEFKTDFESGTTQGWGKNSGASELKIEKDENSSNVLVISGQEKNIGINIPCRIKVTDKTVIEFDFRCYAQTDLHYLAFSAVVQGKDKPFWLHSPGGNALTNPVRGKWHHLVIPATGLMNPNRVSLAPGDVITAFSIHQIYSDGGPHSFMIDNFKVYEGQGDIKFTDVGDFLVPKKESLNKTPSVERNSADAFPLATVSECNAPLIDGDLNDPCWRNAVEVSVLPNNSGKKISENTRFLLAYDKENLYIGVRAGQCYLDPVLNLLDKTKCKAAAHDGAVYRDDSVEIFLLPGTDFYYQFAINSDGVVFDGKDKSSAWNSKGLKKSVKKDLREWTLEMAIPFSDIGLSAAPDSSTPAWRANFCRSNPAKGEISAWSPTEKGFHYVSAFGFVKFNKVSPLVQCESITQSTGAVSMNIICEGRDPVLDISGSQNDISLKPGERKELELKFKPDAEGNGQIRISSANKEIFRTPTLRVKRKSSELSFSLDDPAAKVFLNGQAVSGKTLYLEDDVNVIGIDAGNLAKPLEGTFSIGGLSFPVSDFLYSDKAASGWDKPGFKDSSWKLYQGETGKKLYLRHTLVANKCAFAPQLDNNTYYVANKAAVKLSFRLSSPLASPLADYKFHLDVPDGITIPCYEPGQRIYNKYKNTMSVKKEAGRNQIVFAFDSPVPKLPYNFGYNVITMVMKPDFSQDSVNKDLKGKMWGSGRGVHEIPAEFKLKVMPELNGRQPEKIPVATWPHEREVCLATAEMEILPETWRNAGFNMISVSYNHRNQNSLKDMGEFAGTARGNNLKAIYILFGYKDTHVWGDIFEKHPESHLVPMSSVKLTWEKPLCPLYMISSKEMADRISKFAGASDYMLDDMERGITSSCFCPRCRAYFAKENKLANVPDEKEILSTYKDKWILHQVLMNRKIFDFMMASALKGNPGIMSGVYNGYADCPPEQYGMDWSLYKDVDLLTAGYSESTPIISQTRKELGGRPMCPGLILNTDMWEQPYAEQNITARLWKQLVDGGFGGAHFWTWNELDGRGLHAVADFTRGVAAAEKFLDEKNEVPSKDFISGMPDGYVFVYKKDGEYLYLAINKNIAPKKISVTVPEGFEAEDLMTGKTLAAGKNISVEIAPNSVMLLRVKSPKSFLERLWIF